MRSHHHMQRADLRQEHLHRYCRNQILKRYQFVTFNPRSYCFEETIGCYVKASFPCRTVSRLIIWYNKPGDVTKEFWEKAIQFHKTFHGLKIANWYGNHKRSFNLAAYKNDTELSKEFWKIKRRNSVPKRKWRIMRQCSRFNRSSLRCNLYLNKKLEIALFNGKNILNKITELISKCRHVNKYTLLRHDTKD